MCSASPRADSKSVVHLGVVSRALGMVFIGNHCLMGYAHAEPSVSTACRGKAIAIDIAKGLSFMHRNHVIHFDIKR